MVSSATLESLKDQTSEASATHSELFYQTWTWWDLTRTHKKGFQIIFLALWFSGVNAFLTSIYAQRNHRSQYFVNKIFYQQFVCEIQVLGPKKKKKLIQMPYSRLKERILTSHVFWRLYVQKAIPETSMLNRHPHFPSLTELSICVQVKIKKVHPCMLLLAILQGKRLVPS